MGNEKLHRAAKSDKYTCQDGPYTLRDSTDRTMTSTSVTDHVSVSHLQATLDGLLRLRRQGVLCDVTIVCGDQRIQAHKAVLASTSPYFEAMFTGGMVESRGSEVVLHDVEPNCMEQIIDFMYTTRIRISEDNVQSLLPVANLMQMEAVKGACCQFLKDQMDSCNCLGFLMFADDYSCEELFESSKKFALKNFVSVTRTEEFLNLSFCRLLELISDDNLCAIDEAQVFVATMNWVRFDTSSRRQHLFELLSVIKLPLMTRDFLMYTVEPDELIKSCSQSKDLIIEAMKYHLLPEMRPYLRCNRTQPRQNGLQVPILFAMGGGSLFAIHCECECYDPRTNRWCMVAPMVSRRSKLGVGVVYGLLHAVGGFDGSHDLATVEVYNPKTNSWSTCSPMGTRRSCLGVAVLHNLLYAVGGYDGASCLHSVERYDPLAQQWTSVSPMHYRRRYVSVGVLEEPACIIAAGGYDGSSHLNALEVYDPTSNMWSIKCPMLTARSSGSGAVLNGFFYIAGGTDGSYCLNTVERYNPQTDTWLSLAPMMTARSSHSLVALSNRLYIIGGNDGSSSLNSVEVFEVESNKWMSGIPMSTRRSSVGVAVTWIVS